jgi:hypothetical protein
MTIDFSEIFLSEIISLRLRIKERANKLVSNSFGIVCFVCGIFPGFCNLLCEVTLNTSIKKNTVMKVGMVLPEAGSQATRENIIQAAKQAEQERFDSLWVWERLFMSYKSANTISKYS